MIPRHPKPPHPRGVRCPVGHWLFLLKEVLSLRNPPPAQTLDPKAPLSRHRWTHEISPDSIRNGRRRVSAMARTMGDVPKSHQEGERERERHRDRERERERLQLRQEPQGENHKSSLGARCLPLYPDVPSIRLEPGRWGSFHSDQTLDIARRWGGPLRGGGPCVHERERERERERASERQRERERNID